MSLRPIQSKLFLYLQPLVLVLLDITPMMTVLEGVVMELQDCALPLLRGSQKAFFLYLYDVLTQLLDLGTAVAGIKHRNVLDDAVLFLYFVDVKLT